MVSSGGKLALLTDEAASNRAKALLTVYNLSKAPSVDLKTADGKDPCELYQLLKDEGQKPVAEVSIIPFSGKAAAILNFVAPLETDLQAALGLQIDTGKEHRYPFLVCAPIGCVSRIGMTADELGAMKRGSSGKVTLLPFGADPAKDLVNLTMSLKGFTAGFTALEATVATNQ